MDEQLFNQDDVVRASNERKIQLEQIEKEQREANAAHECRDTYINNLHFALEMFCKYAKKFPEFATNSGFEPKYFPKNPDRYSFPFSIYLILGELPENGETYNQSLFISSDGEKLILMKPSIYDGDDYRSVSYYSFSIISEKQFFDMILPFRIMYSKETIEFYIPEDIQCIFASFICKSESYYDYSDASSWKYRVKQLYSKEEIERIIKKHFIHIISVRWGFNPKYSYYCNNPNPSGGCYIATSIYKTYDCPQVWVLRRYRDHFLAKSFIGRIFIWIYYHISPSLVKSCGSTRWFRCFWKRVLDRLVLSLKNKGIDDTPYNGN